MARAGTRTRTRAGEGRGWMRYVLCNYYIRIVIVISSSVIIVIIVIISTTSNHSILCTYPHLHPFIHPVRPTRHCVHRVRSWERAARSSRELCQAVVVFGVGGESGFAQKSGQVAARTAIEFLSGSDGHSSCAAHQVARSRQCLLQ